MVVTTYIEKGFGMSIKTVMRTMLCTMQLSARSCGDERHPFSTKYLLEKFVSVKKTVAESARKSGTRTESYPGLTSYSEFDSPVTTTQAKIKSIPSRCAFANLSLKTKKNRIAVKKGVSE